MDSTAIPHVATCIQHYFCHFIQITKKNFCFIHFTSHCWRHDVMTYNSFTLERKTENVYINSSDSNKWSWSIFLFMLFITSYIHSLWTLQINTTLFIHLTIILSQSIRLITFHWKNIFICIYIKKSNEFLAMT